MAGMFEYTSAVLGVGLDGFSDFDHDLINDLAAEGWEPVNMAGVHNGFAAVVLFRREVQPPPRRAATKPPAKKKTASRGAR